MANMVINSYTGTGRGMGRNGMNAPTFAYYTVYKKFPSPLILGREASHETKDINGIPIDVHIPTNAIKKLMKIKDIESRASCEGDSERHLTFFIFRPKDQRLEYVRELCVHLKEQGLKCEYDIGPEKMFRMCLSDKLWYSDRNKSKFEKWWNQLPDKLNKALNQTNEALKEEDDSLSSLNSTMFMEILNDKTLTPKTKAFILLTGGNKSFREKIKNKIKQNKKEKRSEK